MNSFSAFMAELKRRKVLRVAAVYGATAFAVLQAADMLFPRLGLPDWTVTFVIALALVGFPMALALAWIFDSTPAGLRRTAPADPGEIQAIIQQPRAGRWLAGFAALLGLLLLAGGAAWKLGFGRPAHAGEYDSIAVLPFVNMSGDSGNDYFGDGLAEELLNALSGIQGLKVAARTSAFALKDAHLDVRRIGDTLSVATVLEGSVRRSADRIRVTAQLSDARTGYNLWSETYDRPLTDLFVVQDEISQQIVSALSMRFTKKGESLYRGGTKDVQAYDKYLAGREKWRTRQIEQLREAITLFEQAIARDSSFALAWSGLADAIDALAWRSIPDLNMVPRARYAAQRALILDPELAEAWASVGVLALDFDRDFRVSEMALKRAIALKPSYASPLSWLSDVFRYSGRPQESLQFTQRAVELDPLSSLGLSGHMQTLMNLGRWSEARATADKIIAIGAIDPGFDVNVLSAGSNLSYNASELQAVAIEWARARGVPDADRAATIGRAILDATQRRAALALLDECDRLGVNGRDVGEIRVALGDTLGALASLERALAEHEPTLVITGTDWAYDPLRSNPRFQAILQAIGMSDLRKAR